MGRRTPSIIQSFNYAFEGVIHVLRSERNMRIHFAVATGVLILASVEGIEFVELGNEDVVRHVLVQRIVEAYKQHAEETGGNRRR